MSKLFLGIFAVRTRMETRRVSCDCVRQVLKVLHARNRNVTGLSNLCVVWKSCFLLSRGLLICFRGQRSQCRLCRYRVSCEMLHTVAARIARVVAAMCFQCAASQRRRYSDRRQLCGDMCLLSTMSWPLWGPPELSWGSYQNTPACQTMITPGTLCSLSLQCTREYSANVSSAMLPRCVLSATRPMNRQLSLKSTMFASASCWSELVGCSRNCRKCTHSSLMAQDDR